MNDDLFQLAAQLLQEETDKWEEENNSIVMVAKEMAHQMLEIAKFARGRNRLQVPQNASKSGSCRSLYGLVTKTFCQASDISSAMFNKIVFLLTV